jgi:DNA polymerase-3 subunit gamma/tau
MEQDQPQAPILPPATAELIPAEVVKAVPNLSAAEEPAFAFAAAPARELVSLPLETPDPTPVATSAPTPVPELLAPPKVPTVVLDVETLWPSLVERVRKERSFISMWVESGVLEEIRDGAAVFVFAEEQSLAADYISKDGHRDFLEGLLLEITGAPLTVRTELRDSVQRRPVAQPPPPVKAVAKDPMEEFKNDPLIRKALEIFKARLEAVQ